MTQRVRYALRYLTSEELEAFLFKLPFHDRDDFKSFIKEMNKCEHHFEAKMQLKKMFQDFNWSRQLYKLCLDVINLCIDYESRTGSISKSKDVVVVKKFI